MRCLAVLLTCLLAGSCYRSDRSASRLEAALGEGNLDAVQEVVRNEFPDVRHMPAAQLHDLLSRTDPPVLLDARSEEEFAVSHLPGAIRIDPDDLPAVECTQPIVVYCSVGWRSAKVARQLSAAGFFDVSNLDGSIFRWAIESRPMVNERGAARVVHPYNASWGELLPEELRSPL